MKRLGEPGFWLLVFPAVLLAQSALGLGVIAGTYMVKAKLGQLG